MPIWFEWILSITSLIANVMVISGIAVYLNNRPAKRKFLLTNIAIDDPEPCTGNEILSKQKIKIWFYNKTNSQFYINRINIYDIGAIEHLRNFKHEDELKDIHNYSSVYYSEDGHNNPTINVCVNPCSPCVIDGYLLLDEGEQLPEQITLVVVTATKKIFKYDIHTVAQHELT